MSSRFMTLAGLAAVAVIALAWSAFAADGDNQDQGDESGQRDRFSIPVPPMHGERGEGIVMPAPPGASGEDGEPVPGRPPMVHHIAGPDGPLGGEISYGELHVQRDGEEVVVRVDHGEIAAVDADSITVSEANGDEVEIPVDEETDVFGGPFRGDLSVEDLETGETVHVSREDGEPAETIGVLPDIDELREHMPPPPGLEEGEDGLNEDGK